ncbi:MAG: hypothetical protein RSF42_10955 [Comamonas sp.]
MTDKAEALRAKAVEHKKLTAMLGHEGFVLGIDPDDLLALLDRIASLEAELIQQTNRAASAEQQATALNRRLDDANAMGNDARNKLAKLSRANEPVCWGIYDSQGFYETRDTEAQAKSFCHHYNARDRKAGFGLAPYSYSAYPSATQSIQGAETRNLPVPTNQKISGVVSED